jgi:hypothetical protein
VWLSLAYVFMIAGNPGIGEELCRDFFENVLRVYSGAPNAGTF